MFELVLIVVGLLLVSFLCSVLESVILSITEVYIQTLVDGGSRAGRLLEKMKINIEEPITAILTLNTISHTMGAALSGAIALQIFGSQWMALFSACLTLLILIFSEIIPKTIGAHYWKSFGPVSGYVLRGMIIILKPLIVPIQFISGLFFKGESRTHISKAEVYSTIRAGHDQGIIGSSEFSFINNIFSLQDIKVKDVMTPRTVVFSLSEELKVSDIHREKTVLQFSRIPLYNPTDNSVPLVVMRRDLMDAIASKKLGQAVKTMGVIPLYIPESLNILKLLDLLIKEKKHLAIVINEYGDYTGIVTLEDAIESLIGMEIVDEFDPAEDMQEVARKKMQELS